MKLKIEYMPIGELKPYAGNAKLHPAEQVEQIKKSIQEFGMNDPIAIWKNGEIIEGHGRLIAATELGLDVVPVIRLDSLTDEQRRAYSLIHNKINMNTGFDKDLLELELANIDSISMVDFGFDDEDFFSPNDLGDDVPDISKYSKNVKIPQYEPQGDLPEISDLVDCGKQKELVEEIERADIPQDVKDFLKLAAQRHNVFNYRNIAEFYVHQSAEVQRLMEKSALVIIDVDDAIANGYVRLTSTIAEILGADDGEE